jgi:hypothetical protein
MAISYPLELPTGRSAAQVKMRRANVVAAPPSPFSGITQTTTYPGQWWEADITLPPIWGDVADDWIVFLASCQGKLGTFMLGDPSRALPRGAAVNDAGSPEFVADGSVGNNLSIRGMPTSVTNYLLKADYLQIGSGTAARYHMLLSNLSSDGDGEGACNVWPRIRNPIDDGTAITVINAKGCFRMMSNIAENDIRPGFMPIHDVTFSVREAMPYG